tara:strand:+ start:171 stop:497 length:327 start_codon:yes stop_codon:yes gene_type:complete
MSDLIINAGSFDQNVVAGTPIKERKIVKVTNALGKLKKLQTIQFRYKPEVDSDQRLRAGFSAQQVQQVIPEAVFEEDGYLMLDMDVLKAYVREAKKELRKINKIKVKL